MTETQFFTTACHFNHCQHVKTAEAQTAAADVIAKIDKQVRS